MTTGNIKILGWWITDQRPQQWHPNPPLSNVLLQSLQRSLNADLGGTLFSKSIVQTSFVQSYMSLDALALSTILVYQPVLWRTCESFLIVFVPKHGIEWFQIIFRVNLLLRSIHTIRLSYEILHFGVCDYVIKAQFLLAIRSRMLQLVLKTRMTELDTSKWTIICDNRIV